MLHSHISSECKVIERCSGTNSSSVSNFPIFHAFNLLCNLNWQWKLLDVCNQMGTMCSGCWSRRQTNQQQKHTQPYDVHAKNQLDLSFVCTSLRRPNFNGSTWSHLCYMLFFQKKNIPYKKCVCVCVVGYAHMTCTAFNRVWGECREKKKCVDSIRQNFINLVTRSVKRPAKNLNPFSVIFLACRKSAFIYFF